MQLEHVKRYCATKSLSVNRSQITVAATISSQIGGA